MSALLDCKNKARASKQKDPEGVSSPLYKLSDDLRTYPVCYTAHICYMLYVIRLTYVAPLTYVRLLTWVTPFMYVALLLHAEPLT